MRTGQFRRLPKSPSAPAMGLRLALREYCVGGRGVVLEPLQPPTHLPGNHGIFSIRTNQTEGHAFHAPLTQFKRHTHSTRPSPSQRGHAFHAPLTQFKRPKACGAPLIQSERRAARHSSSQRGVRRATHLVREACGAPLIQSERHAEVPLDKTPAAEPTTRRGKLHAVAAKGST